MVVPGLHDGPDFKFLHSDAPWLPLVQSILGKDAALIHTGCILSMPGSDTQKWHR